MSNKLTLRIKQGGTFQKSFRWEVEPYVYTPITGVSNAAPCVVSCPGHLLLPNQSFLVQSVKGMVELNAKDNIKLEEWFRATVLGPDSIAINRVNSLDFKAYISGGVLKYRSVVDLTGYTAQMDICDKPGGNKLYRLSTAKGNLKIDPVLQLISIDIPEADAIAMTWKKGTYDLELRSPAGVVISFLWGDVITTKENTTV